MYGLMPNGDDDDVGYAHCLDSYALELFALQLYLRDQIFKIIYTVCLYKSDTWALDVVFVTRSRAMHCVLADTPRFM